MKRRVLVVAVLLLVLGVVALLGARHVAERQRWTRNVRHDATWLFDALKRGDVRPLAFHAAQSDADAQRVLAERLVTHATTLAQTDFSALTPRFSSSDGTITASFECTDGLRVVFRAVPNGDDWTLTAVTPPS